ncbi:hypothetical protein ACFL1M_02830 [Patescibacteria group bacterium]
MEAMGRRKEEFESHADYLDTPGSVGVVVVFHDPFEGEVGDIWRLEGGETFTLTEFRVRAYVVLSTISGELAVVPYHANIDKFGHLPVVHKEDQGLLDLLPQIDPGYAELDGPYERSSFALVSLAGDESKGNEKAQRLMKLMSIVGTPGRDAINLEHQNDLRDEIAELTVALIKAPPAQMEDDGIPF